MMRVMLLALGLVLGGCGAPELPAQTPPAAATVAAAVPGPELTVARVSDGDTVALSDGRKIRVLGIDTPESVKPNAPVDCWGLEASAFARATLLGQRVVVTADPSQDARDHFGRDLAYLEVAGGDYSVMAAEAGAARSYVYAGKPVSKAPAIRAAELRAQAAGRGLWGACGPVAASTTSTVPSPSSTRPTPTPRTPAPAIDAPEAPAAQVAAFGSCAAAREAGAAPLRRGGPGYSRKLDGDGDGVACE